MDALLYDAVRQGNVEEALRETCQCLIQERWAVLEETWVRLVAFFGESLRANEVNRGSAATTNGESKGSNATTTFYRMATELARVLEQDDLPVKQALLFTTKLLLVFKRPYLKVAASSAANLQRLRARIIQYFPPDAQLTRSGKMKFQRFLPTDPEEAAFAERIIAGLLQLSETGADPTDFKGALEYLARKKLVLYTAPVLKLATPSPVADTPPAEDLVPYLWMILKVIKPLSFDETIETLYYHAYKPSFKGSRLGFLYAMAFLTENAATSVEPLWSATEQVLLDRVLENALVLWKEAKAPPPEAAPEPEEPLFIPLRPVRAHAEPVEEPVAPPETTHTKTKEKTKVKKTIHITRGRGRNRLGRQLDYEPTERDDEPIKLKDLDENDTYDTEDETDFIQPITSGLRGFDLKDNRRKKKEDATHRDSSGHRGVYLSKARP